MEMCVIQVGDFNYSLMVINISLPILFLSPLTYVYISRLYVKRQLSINHCFQITGPREQGRLVVQDIPCSNKNDYNWKTL